MTTSGAASPRPIWARLAVDPLAEPLARWMSRRRQVTPNRVTGLAVAAAIGAIACFATGHLRVGGLLFLLRYFFDCVDGMVARNQRTSSAVGANFDITADVLGIHLISAALVWHLVTDQGLAPAVGVGLLATLGIHDWALSHRKRLAAQAEFGDGGSDHDWHPDLPGLKQWIATTRRLNMFAFPWAVEIEIALFGLAPLLLPDSAVVALVPWGIGAYLVVAAVNLIRTWRIAVRLDRLAHAQKVGSDD